MGSMRIAETEEFDKVFDLIIKSFPSDEYRTYSEQKSLLKEPEYKIYVLCDEECDSFKAFISIWQFESFAYIEHFAVNPSYRNCGLGSVILAEIKKMLPVMLCLEVEPPTTELARRRIEFYKRNGFYYTGYSYVQPPYSKNKKPVELFVMISEGEISEERFRKIKEEIFAKVYKM